MSTPYIDHTQFHECSARLRSFFISKGFKEFPSQALPSILAACEDPSTIGTFSSGGMLFALPQTGQMWLEHALLKNPDVSGFFCATTSYRDEPNPTPGRHLRIFPMFEFETRGGLETLRALEVELLSFLGFGKTPNIYDTYSAVANRYKVKEVTGEIEAKIGQDEGPVFFLESFPIETSPFWNMRLDGKIARKIDVLLHGMETIGSAERSIDPTTMRSMFYTISDGIYAKTLFEKFGRERVEKELEEFLALPFFERSGGGIGMTRLMRAMQLSNLF
ncbi:MAG: amino acid--tRNA ligase-related protein [Patescibacteria group bacterium]|mgnify:CR=1 FL=1